MTYQFRKNYYTLDNLLSSKNNLGKNSESTQLLEAEDARDNYLAREDNKHNACALEDRPEIKEEPGDSKGETTHRKVFQRATKYLQEGLQVNSVMFSNSLISFHSSVQPVTEPEQELEHEVEERPHRKPND
jgi:hypothetical protein